MLAATAVLRSVICVGGVYAVHCSQECNDGALDSRHIGVVFDTDGE